MHFYNSFSISYDLFPFAETSPATEMFSMNDPPAMNRALQPRPLAKHVPAHHH
jgi:hypothetical protein